MTGRAQGNATGNLRTAYWSLSALLKAIQLHKQRLVIVGEMDERQGEALGSWNLGLAYKEVEKLKKVIEATQISVDFAREIVHPDPEEDTIYVEELRKKLHSGASCSD